MDQDQADRMALAAALADAGAKTDEESLQRVHRELWRIRWNYIDRIAKKMPGGGGRPSKKLVKLNKALIQWLGAPYNEGYEQTFTVEHVLVHGFDDLKIAAMNWLRDRTTEVVGELESTRPQVRTENATTTLMYDLLSLHREETGVQSYSDGGPAHEFVKACAAIVYTGVVVPAEGFRQLMDEVEARRRKKSTTNRKKRSPGQEVVLQK